AVAEAQAGRKRAQADFDFWQTENKTIVKMAEQKVLDEQTRNATLSRLRAAEAAREEVEAKVRSAEAAKVESEARRDRAKADVTVADAKARVAAAEEGRLTAMLGYTRLTAPFDGMVTARHVDVGHFLQPSGRDTPLFVVTRMDPVRVFVEVPE